MSTIHYDGPGAIIGVGISPCGNKEPDVGQEDLTK